MDLGDLLEESSGEYLEIFAQTLLEIKFETSALNDPQITLKTTEYTLDHICTTSIPRVPKFNPFHSMASSLIVTGHLRQMRRMTQNGFEHYQVTRTPYMLY